MENMAVKVKSTFHKPDYRDKIGIATKQDSDTHPWMVVFHGNSLNCSTVHGFQEDELEVVGDLEWWYRDFMAKCIQSGSITPHVLLKLVDMCYPSMLRVPNKEVEELQAFLNDKYAYDFKLPTKK